MKNTLLAIGIRPRFLFRDTKSTRKKGDP